MIRSVFDNMLEILNLAVFELEYQHRSKTSFGEKWVNSSSTKTKIEKLKKFLYKNISEALQMPTSKEFHKIVIYPLLGVSHKALTEEIWKNIRNPNDSAPNSLFNEIFYKMVPNELFILFTQIIDWEHKKYPILLDNVLSQNKNIMKRADTQDVFDYYIYFMDVLSSEQIVSLFDLDALKHTVSRDMGEVGGESNYFVCNSSFLFEDWSSNTRITKIF